MLEDAYSHKSITWLWLKENWLIITTHGSVIILFTRLIWLIISGGFFIDPVRQTTTLTGKFAIGYLLLSLACTPIVTVFGWSKVLQIRKTLGLYAFGFALFHGLTYVGWDYRFNFSLLFPNLQYERYILVGGSAFIILMLLAVTSLDFLRVRLGHYWKPIQRFVYVACILAVVHVVWLRKSPVESIPLIAIALALLLLRVPWLKRVIIQIRQSIIKGMNPT